MRYIYIAEVEVDEPVDLDEIAFDFLIHGFNVVSAISFPAPHQINKKENGEEKGSGPRRRGTSL